MTINWIKCSERMPPDSGKEVIVQYWNLRESVTTGKRLNAVAGLLLNETKWTPYTEQVWKELNK